MIYRNSLQGLGQKLLPLISSFIEFIGKIVFVAWIIPWAGYTGVILCEPLLWLVMTAQLYISLYQHPWIKEGKENLGCRRTILASFIKEKSVSSSENRLDLCYNKKD